MVKRIFSLVLFQLHLIKKFQWSNKVHFKPYWKVMMSMIISSAIETKQKGMSLPIIFCFEESIFHTINLEHIAL
jgi:hypothetical protein